MIQDLHSHTYYSFCGEDKPESILEAAIAGGIELFGISDHQYGVAGYRPSTEFHDPAAFLVDYQRAVDRYLAHMTLLKEKYAGRLQMRCGIEVATIRQPYLTLPPEVDISRFDYCLVEHIDHTDTYAPDLFAFAARCGCARVGIAHTDLFAYMERRGEEPAAFLRRMAEQEIFWEMNVSYDSIHQYREHAYVKAFMQDERQQALVRESGVCLSVGFDGHRVRDYRPDRVTDACRAIERMGIPLVFAE